MCTCSCLDVPPHPFASLPLLLSLPLSLAPAGPMPPPCCTPYACACVRPGWYRRGCGSSTVCSLARGPAVDRQELGHETGLCPGRRRVCAAQGSVRAPLRVKRGAYRGGHDMGTPVRGCRPKPGQGSTHLTHTAPCPIVVHPQAIKAVTASVPGMTTDLAAAVWLYTCESPLYPQLNDKLRSVTPQGDGHN